jgi:glycosyltransferase involved in cell wall biosynthesis
MKMPWKTGKETTAATPIYAAHSVCRLFQRHTECAGYMDITHVIPYMHPRAGGPPVVADRVCRHLAHCGWSSRLLTTDAMAQDDSPQWIAQYGDGYELAVFPSRGRGAYAYSRSLAAEIDALVAASRLVHIHTAWTYPTWAAIRACRRRGVPFVVMPHGMLDPNSLARKPLRKWVYGRLIQWPQFRAAAAMVYTHAEERRLAEQSVARLPPGFVVPLGADEPPPESRDALAEAFLSRFPELRGRTLVLFFGRLHPKKGIDLLIPAMRRVAQRHDRAHLLLVGPGEADCLDSFRRMADREGLAERTTFAGPMSGQAKWEAMAAAAVFALPSYQENFALAAVEAMRAGLPVVLSRRVNLWSDVVEAGAGVACELEVESLAEAVGRYLADPVLAECAGCQGQRLAAEKFTWDRTAAALDAVYRHVLQKGPGRA